MKKELLVFGSLLCLMSGIGAVRAQTCATPPSCASLGYTMTSSECSGQPTLVCPFDASAVFCAGTASSGGAGGSTGGGAGSGLTESCNGDCFVAFTENPNGGYLKLIQKYKFVDGGSNNTECENVCRQNGMSNNVYGTQFDVRSLCVEANKTSGSYYYYNPSYGNNFGYSHAKINCSNFQISSSTSSGTVGASTGCLCAKIIG